MYYLIDFISKGRTLSVGNPLSGILSVTGQAATVLGAAQMSSTSTSATISNKRLYPNVFRSYVPSPSMSGALVDLLQSFYEEQGIGWNEIALLISSESYGISMANSFLSAASETDLNIIEYQQFLIGTTDLAIEMSEIKKSGARIIVTFAFSGYRAIISEADNFNLVDDNHVFVIGPNLSSDSTIYTNPDGSFDEKTLDLMRGTLASQAYISRSSEVYLQFENQWQNLDPNIITGAGPGTIPSISPTLTYDMGVALGLALIEAEKQNFTPENPPTANQWAEILKPITFEGVTGPYSYDKNGDRAMDIGIQNFNSDAKKFETVAKWSPQTRKIEYFSPIVWHDNTTNFPDLDIRPPFDYWSCSKKEKRTDETGKTITLHSPDGDSSVDDIDITYHCDNFIDCKNLSDESNDCSSNYVILFIIFGIITGILILLTCCLIPFVILFGFIIPRTRIRASTPIFLLIILFSSVIGYSSTFAWYGQPHPVACGFQPWLLGFSIVSLIAALSAKSWRVWRIFANMLKRTVITNTQIMIFYLIMIIPAIIILIIWSIVSTPTAKLEERDGEDHYVCTTGGFTGYPGGYVFFAILLTYATLLLLFAAFISIVTRNVPSMFNESKLIAISIYNLGFLAAVVVPVFLVLQEFNPFAAWIIRTIAILYAFTATLLLQFTSKIYGLIFIDKFKDNTSITLVSTSKSENLSLDTNLT